MQENNFENNIRQKMEELMITPSAPVWQKIEAQIKKKKERRRIIFWLLPVVLLAGGLFFWQQTLNKNLVATNQIPAKQVTKTAGTNNINNALNEKDAAHSEGKLFQKPIEQNHLNKATRIKKADGLTNKSELKKEQNKTPNEPSITPLNDNSRAQVLIDKDAGHGVLKKLQEGSVDDSRNNKTIATTINKEVSKALQDSGSTNPKNSVLTSDTTTVKDSAQQKPLLKNARKWMVVLNSRIGSSGTTKLFNGSNQKAMQDALSTIPSSSTTAPNLPPAQPSQGWAFGLGMNLKKPLAENLFFITGLQYSYYSTHMPVGKKMDTASSLQFSRANTAVYANSNRQYQYTTRYHFIELPVGIQYGLFKKLPLQVQHGLSIGQLLGTNALVYDSAANVYYKSNAGLHKTTLNFFTAVEYKIVRNKKMEINLGPQVQYGLTPFYKTSSAAKQHLFFVGLSAGMGF